MVVVIVVVVALVVVVVVAVVVRLGGRIAALGHGISLAVKSSSLL